MRSVFIHGKEVRRSLGHRDRELAARQAYEFLAALATTDRAVESGTLTVSALASMYLQSPSHQDKKTRTQNEDAARIARLIAFLGPNRDIASLTESDLRRFTSARRRGDSTLLGVRPGVAVGDRSVQADLVALHTMCNWGAKERDRHGRRLLRENPFRGINLPREKNPRRPLMNHAVFERLLEVAEKVDSHLAPLLTIADASGRRLSAIRQLRWSDVDFERGTVRWRKDHDKKGYESTLPMSAAMQSALDALKSRCQTTTEWVFPSPKNPLHPAGRHLLDRWLRRAYRLAGLQQEKGGLWHPIRRKFATERKGYAAVDVAAAGGWRDLRTVQMVYQQADADSVRNALLNPSHRLAPMPVSA